MAQHERSAKPRRAHTRAKVAGDSTPRLPHESDELPGSQARAPHDVAKRAYSDARRGLPDTDRGPVVDELYGRTLRERRARKSGR
jgi:hypothetical protein